MVIKTPFNTKNEVWIMHENKPTRCVVEKIHIRVEEYSDGPKVNIEYVLGAYKEGKTYASTIQYSGSTTVQTFRESQMFRSKQALLKTL